MVENENVKVYELAKELGIETLALVDKLNGLNIKVKSHMSELGPDEVQVARAQLGKRDSASSAKTSAKTATKKPATKTAAAKTTTTKTAAAKTAASSTATATRKKSAAGATAAGPATLVETPKGEAAAPAKAAAPIIRRRTGAAGSEATSPSRTASEPAQDSAYSRQATSVGETEAYESAEGPESHTEATDLAASRSEDSSREFVQISASETTSFEARDMATGEAGAEEETSAYPLEGSGSSQQDASALQSPAARKPVVLPPRPVAPRRSILKIVEVAAPTQRPMLKPGLAPSAGPKVAPRGTTPTPTPTTAVPGRDGFRIIKMTKENVDEMVAEEAAKKRGGVKEAEIKPEDVRFADYRKKEMVFLPKRKRLPIGKELRRTEKTVMKAAKRVVDMGDSISIQDFAAQVGVKANDVVRKLMGMGQMVTINASIDFDTATLVAGEYQWEVKNTAFKEAEFLDSAQDADEHLVPRPPVVTIMGHVDHGKTSLLDAIREANVAGGEAGGITQHIGAYTVEQNGKLISFVDTPGHEAFTAMRARGANVTDIVVLVVAADDGVMPQTREALSHAKAAGVPIIVAMNKIDKPSANPEKIKQQLAELDLLAEDWGGQTMFIPVSAIKRTNLDKLLEGILLQAEVLDLKSNPDARASGVVLEARLEKGRGPVASVLIKRGTLRVGDPIVSGKSIGRVRALLNHKGETIKEVTPGLAAEVLGWEILPSAGDAFDAPIDEASARKISENRDNQFKAHALATTAKGLSLEDLFSKVQSGNLKELNIVLKSDVFGSAEAIKDSLVKLSNEKVKVKVIFSAPGGVTESDVLLASASNALIIGFNVRPETKARQMAESRHVEIKTYSIIYEVIDDIKKAMVGLLDKKKVEKFLGRAEVRQTFSVPKIGTIAGTSVIDGKITRGANVRLLRESRIIYEGKLSSLKRFKDDAKEVAQGYECGIGLENYNDLKPGDLIEAYMIEMIAPEMTF